MDEVQKATLSVLMNYQLEGRYPDYLISSPDKGKVTGYMNQTKELLEWLVQKL